MSRDTDREASSAMSSPEIDPRVTEAVAAVGESYLPVHVGRPVGARWRQFVEVAAPDVLDEDLRAATAEHDGDLAVGTAFLVARLMSPLALLAGRPVAMSRRGLELDGTSLWLRRHPGGWFDGIALDPPRLLVLADDALAEVPGVEVVDGLDGLRARAVTSATALAAPVVAHARASGRVGQRALWGQLADLLVTAASRPYETTGDAETAIVEAQALLAYDERLWVEPAITRVEVEGGAGLSWRRGSCCLAYRIERYGLCTACPLLDEEEWWRRSVATVHARIQAEHP